MAYQPYTPSTNYISQISVTTIPSPGTVISAAVDTTPVSVLQQATLGANDPAQTTSTQQGFYEAPDPLFRAMNQKSITDLQTLSSGAVGSFLQSKKLVNGNMATIINASLDYVFGGKSKKLSALSPNIKTSNTKRTFIPIIIKTDFNYTVSNITLGAGAREMAGQNSSLPTPLYIIFDSTPEAITFNKTANWAQKDFLGRPEPIFTYQNSGPTTFSLVGKFYAESFEAHGKLLKISDYIMALVTPSEMNYMPSPVTVFIGQWKELRCIVTSVSITFNGPWSVQVNSDDHKNANTPSEKSLIATALGNQSSGSVPSHAPYLFEATFNFTMVGKDNNVQYAEQIISGDQGFSNSSDALTGGDIYQEAALQNAVSYQLQPKPTSKVNTGLYDSSYSTQYTFIGGQIRTVVNSETGYTPAAQTLNIYAGANAANKTTDLGVISNALSAQMLSLFQKANPTSTNTPKTTSSLNPFKKLF